MILLLAVLLLAVLLPIASGSRSCSSPYHQQDIGEDLMCLLVDVVHTVLTQAQASRVQRKRHF